jgi:hypothetical protein
MRTSANPIRSFLSEDAPMNDRFARLASLATLLLIFTFVAGCGPSGPVNEKVTKANLDKIELEMKLADVEAILGPGEPSGPAANAKPGDKLTWKKWRHSSRGSSVIIGFDSTNTVADFVKDIAQ